MSKWMLQIVIFLVALLVILTLLKWIFAAAWLILRFVVVLALIGGVAYFAISFLKKK